MFYRDWLTRPGIRANIPERPGKVMSSRVGGVHILQVTLAVLGGLFVRAIPWFKQILKVFVCGLAGRNGHILKVLWAKSANQYQVLSALNVVLTGVQVSECGGFDPLTLQL